MNGNLSDSSQSEFASLKGHMIGIIQVVAKEHKHMQARLRFPQHVTYPSSQFDRSSFVNFEGILPAALTPFKIVGESYEISKEGIQALQKYLHSRGSKLVFLGGSTGEFASPSVEARKTLATLWCKEVGIIPAIVHVGHSCVASAIELANHAASVGAVAISSVPPFYVPLNSVDEVVSSIEPVAAATPHLPFLYYHIPHFTQVGDKNCTYSVSDIVSHAYPKIPNFVGLKFTSNDFDELKKLVALPFQINILHGGDETLLTALRIGSHGAIGISYNALPHLFSEIVNQFSLGNQDEAEKLQEIGKDFVELTHKYGLFPAQKALMFRLTGVDVGPPMLPLLPVSEEIENKMISEIDEMKDLKKFLQL